MQLRNDYDKDVCNGDVGFVASVDEDDDELTVRFDDGKERNYDEGALDELTLAYACTIHKSQGSEYPAVVIVAASRATSSCSRGTCSTRPSRAENASSSSWPIRARCRWR